MIRPYSKNLIVFAICLAWVIQISQAGELDPAVLKQTLQTQYRSLESSLQSNQFHAPIVVRSDYQDSSASGEIYAVLQFGFDQIASNLNTATSWCDVFLLHVNVKGCVIPGAGNTGREKSNNRQTSLPSDEVTVYAGRAYYQPIEDAFSMQYDFSVSQHQQDYFQIEMIAKEGPFGTSDYELIFEAIPLSKTSSFMHLKYAYRYGTLATIMLDGYLATLGRNKVGFTIKEYDEQQHPVYIKGIEGIVERNSMRYFLAIQAYLDTINQHKTDWKARIIRWYNLAKPYRVQLIEYDEKKYLKSKMKQFSIPNIPEEAHSGEN